MTLRLRFGGVDGGRLLVVAGLVLTTASGWQLSRSDQAETAPPAPVRTFDAPATVPSARVVKPSPRAVASGKPRKSAPPVAKVPVVGLPAWVRLPRSSQAVRIVPVGVDWEHALVLPSIPSVGWWIGSSALGAARGQVVLAGHLDDDQGRIGAFAALSTLRPGEHVTVGAVNRRVTYRIVALQSYRKTALPRSLFAAGGPPRLTLITCGGPFTPGQGYADNVVAIGVPA